MKISLLLLGISAFLLIPQVARCQEVEENGSNSSDGYDVQHFYDKEGNLLYYDSIYVDNEAYDPNSEEFDSLINSLKEQGRGIRYSIRFPRDSFSYSFQLPDGFLDFIPDHKLDIVVPPFDSIVKDLEYRFSITPDDSNQTSVEDDPRYEYHGTDPSPGPELDESLWEVERRIHEFHDRLKRDYREWEQNKKNENIETIPSDPAKKEISQEGIIEI
ncbi:MAG: hypothetical protein JW801_16130 [Bacteroidales bacterium]|nr:hypothetical protein [Bacteroidales bacterium]